MKCECVQCGVTYDSAEFHNCTNPILNTNQPPGAFERLGPQNYLKGETVVQMIEHKGKLFMATTKRVFIFVPEEMSFVPLKFEASTPLEWK